MQFPELEWDDGYNRLPIKQRPLMAAHILATSNDNVTKAGLSTMRYVIKTILGGTLVDESNMANRNCVKAFRAQGLGWQHPLSAASSEHFLALLDNIDAFYCLMPDNTDALALVRVGRGKQELSLHVMGSSGIHIQTYDGSMLKCFRFISTDRGQTTLPVRIAKEAFSSAKTESVTRISASMENHGMRAKHGYHGSHEVEQQDRNRRKFGGSKATPMANQRSPGTGVATAPSNHHGLQTHVGKKNNRSCACFGRKQPAGKTPTARIPNGQLSRAKAAPGC
jgi:hypothetical protein